MDAQRKLLDALMGANRNGERPTSKSKHFSDPDICKYFLCGLCPNELFVNTKMDLGECRNLHSTPLKMAYPLLLLFLTATIMRMPLHLNKHNYDEEVARGKNYGYEYELEKYLEQIVGDCDRKIQRAQKRLEETEKEKEEANLLAAEIKELYAQAEDLGSAGKVEESMELIHRAEELKRKEAAIPAAVAVAAVVAGQELAVSSSSQQQKLRVCDICGAFLSIYDSDRRLADHFGGKLHLGYLQIREKLTELQKDRSEKGNRPREHLQRNTSPSGGYRTNEREQDRYRDRERTRRARDREARERDREKEWDRRKPADRDRGSGRDRERDRDRDRDRDRERDRGRRN